MFGLSIQVLCVTTIISLGVSLVNYLVAFSLGETSIVNAIFNNLYVKYWLYLTGFFFGLTILLFIISFFLKPKNKPVTKISTNNGNNNT